MASRKWFGGRNPIRLNELAGENGYGVLLLVGIALLVAYFFRGDAALL